MIVIIDYGMGNLGSIQNLLKRIGYASVISSSPEEILNASKLILPGVGSFDNGMENIQERGLVDVFNEKVLKMKTPVLGICLGCQLITKSSEEGILPGLGWIDARTIRFSFPEDNNNLKIPHMGWNMARVCKSDPLVDDLNKDQRFYFVHSYHVVCEREEDILMKSFYGYDFVSAVKNNNVVGVQFHPEKSHRFGMHFMKNWALLSS
jgi:imidazole glycerol-phosphate synthase subunit HisH